MSVKFSESNQNENSEIGDDPENLKKDKKYKHLRYNKDINNKIRITLRNNENGVNLLNDRPNPNIDIDEAFANIKRLQFEVIDGLKLSIKQLAAENDKINREREHFHDSVDNLRLQFEKDYAENIDKIKSIEEFIDNKVQKSETLLTEQIEVIEKKFEQRLESFEREYLEPIVDEQKRISENLDEFMSRVENIQLKQDNVSTNSNTNTSIAQSVLSIYGSELGNLVFIYRSHLNQCFLRFS